MTDNDDLQNHQPDQPPEMLHPHKGVFIVAGLVFGALVVLVIFLIIGLNVL